MSYPQNAQKATVPSGSTVSNVITIEQGFAIGLECPTHDGAGVYIQAARESGGTFKRIHHKANVGLGEWYGNTSGSVCMLPIDSAAPFCYLRVETAASQTTARDFYFLTKHWEQK